MAGYYVFFRCWPGFTEAFPFDRFNALPDDKVADALNSFAQEQLRLPEVRERVKKEARRRRRRFIEAIKAQSRRRTGGPALGGAAHGITQQKLVQTRWGAVRHSERRTDPLVCRLGAYLGWWRRDRRIIGEDVGFPAVWFWTSDSQEFVTQLVAELDRLRNLDYDAHELEYYTNPRFGWIATDGLEPGKCASIQRCINSIQNGREPDLRMRKLATEIGSRVVKVAQELSAAWPGEREGGTDATPPAAQTEQGEGDGGAETPAASDAPKPRGRKPDTNAKEDKRIADAWATGRYKRFQELADQLSKPKLAVKQAIDRNRHRKPAGNRRKN